VALHRHRVPVVEGHGGSMLERTNSLLHDENTILRQVIYQKVLIRKHNNQAAPFDEGVLDALRNKKRRGDQPVQQKERHLPHQHPLRLHFGGILPLPGQTRPPGEGRRGAGQRDQELRGQRQARHHRARGQERPDFDVLPEAGDVTAKARALD